MPNIPEHQERPSTIDPLKSGNGSRERDRYWHGAPKRYSFQERANRENRAWLAINLAGRKHTPFLEGLCLVATLGVVPITRLPESNWPPVESGKPCGRWKDRFVAAVEGGAEEEDGGDSAHNLGEVRGLFRVEGTAKQREFAIAEPLFQHLVASERVIPNVDRDRRPKRLSVEMDIDAGFSKQGEGIFQVERLSRCQRGELFPFDCAPLSFRRQTLTGHDGAALSAVSPTRREFEGGFEICILGKFESSQERPFRD